jgi:hypothetical protein
MVATDISAGFKLAEPAATLTDPSANAQVVVPNDNQDLQAESRASFIGVGEEPGRGPCRF